MAVNELPADAVHNNCAMVASLLRALDLELAARELEPDDPDAQFAWSAFAGAKSRTMQCGIDGPYHAAAAALLAFDEIENITVGHAFHSEGRKVIDYQDAVREFRLVRKALHGIWEYFASNDPKLLQSLAPLAKHCDINEI